MFLRICCIKIELGLGCNLLFLKSFKIINTLASNSLKKSIRSLKDKRECMFEALKGGLYPNHLVYSSLVLTGAILLLVMFENFLYFFGEWGVPC